MEFQRTVKFAADIHYKDSNLTHIDQPMKEFIEDLKETKPLITVIGGDYFDKRVGAEEEAYKIAIDNILEMAKFTKYLIFVKGTLSHDYDTLKILRSLNKIQKNILYFHSMEEVQLDEFKILIIPEEYPADPEEYYKNAFSKKYDFVFGHGDIQGAKLHSGINNTMLKGFRFNLTELSELADFIFFGHIHKHQFLKHNVVYPGSLARFKHGEEEAKGYLSLDIDNKIVEFREVTASIFKTITIDNEDEWAKIKERLENNGDDENLSFKLSKDLKHLKSDIDEISNSKNIFKDITVDGDDNELMYDDIDSLTINEQFEMILNSDYENKKIPKKNQAFFNSDSINKVVNTILEDIGNN